MTRPAHLTETLDMAEAQFRSLPREALRVLEAVGAQHENWRSRETGEYGVTIYMPAGTMARLMAVCEPALAA